AGGGRAGGAPRAAGGGGAPRHRGALSPPANSPPRRDIDGRGRLDVDLEPVERVHGPAGIKVRCATRRRAYIIIDDRDTGLMCPTERIAVGLGRHTVVTYDPSSEQSDRQEVTVKETHFSVKGTVP